MKQFILKNRKALLGILACMLIAGVTMSFQLPFGPIDKLDSITESNDTIPTKKEKKPDALTMKEYDELINKLEKQVLELQQQITKEKLQQVHEDVNNSLSKVDFDKIKLDIDKAMKEIDFEKIEQSVQTALKEIDWDKMNEEVKQSLLEAKKEIAAIDMTAIKKEMEKAKFELDKSRKEIEKIDFDAIMKDAGKEIENAKEEMRSSKAMISEMESEGLINRKDGFSIEFKDKSLYINDKKQPAATWEKYRKYIKQDRYKLNISGE